MSAKSKNNVDIDIKRGERSSVSKRQKKKLIPTTRRSSIPIENGSENKK
jgi:hypothetical protein